MKKKKSSSNYNTEQCKNRTALRMAFKGTIALLQFKNIGIKNFKGRKVICKKNRRSFPLN
jgi:hypothetical protein